MKGDSNYAVFAIRNSCSYRSCGAVHHFNKCKTDCLRFFADMSVDFGNRTDCFNCRSTYCKINYFNSRSLYTHFSNHNIFLNIVIKPLFSGWFFILALIILLLIFLLMVFLHLVFLLFLQIMVLLIKLLFVVFFSLLLMELCLL